MNSSTLEMVDAPRRVNASTVAVENGWEITANSKYDWGGGRGRNRLRLCFADNLKSNVKRRLSPRRRPFPSTEGGVF